MWRISFTLFLGFLFPLVIFLFFILFPATLTGRYQLFGPGSRHYAETQLLQRIDRLKASTSDDVLFLWYTGRSYTGMEIRDFDLTNSVDAMACVEHTPSWFEFLSVTSVWHNSLGKLRPERKAQIEHFIESMPPSNSTGPVEDTLTVAVNRNGKLTIYHYQLDFNSKDPSEKIPAEIKNLALGL